ncbi:putative porin [Mesonia aquimarina]|uniref:putative porin n=1 Tax=Mesonia aquimarina TaxID=1504967 RepID=UPI000EF61C5D|nr:putative porin [Mesonia aquimarina]
MKKYLFLLILIVLPAVLFSQTLRTNQNGNTRNINNQDDNKTVVDNREKPPIEDYKIISVENDTTYVDTTLSIYKDYKYNYLRKDNFELLPFTNVGQPYNQLGYSFQDVSLLPDIGARGKHFPYYEVDDIHYYNVPTPLTELYFKTTFEQGQNVDAFFTTNMTPRLNFSIAYRGLRSLGRYQHILASQGSFRFTINYQTKNNRYDLKTHFVSQDLSNEENGGLSPQANQQYSSGDDEFDDRSVLEVNYEDAETLLLTKRFFLKHHYKVLKGNDSTGNNQLRIGHQLNFTDKEYSFTQETAFAGYGNTYEDTSLRDEVEYQSVANTLYGRYQNNILGDFTFKTRFTDYNYGYRSKLILDDGVIPNRLTGNFLSVGGAYQKRIGGFNLKADAMINLSDEFSGNYIKAKADYKLNENYAVEAGIAVNSRAPNFNFLLFQSDYVNYNWRNTYDNIQSQNISLTLNAKKIANIEADFTQINNYTYFGLRDNIAENTEADSLVTPFQYGENVSYAKYKLKRKFTLGHFSLDNTIMYQQVLNGKDVFRVPDFVTRQALYYDNHFFERNLYLQTGFIFKYFTSYKANAYDPVLAEFFVQNDYELEGFPSLDFIVNAKIRQTRIFFKLENAQFLWNQNTSFSSPIHPSRDFSLRFGLVWNFFL